jgi:outer membrane receptor protein involved in Fe transport
MKRALAICFASSVAWSVVTPALAQSVPPAAVSAQEPQLGEIIVTAQRRSERAESTPLAITAATGEKLANAGVVSGFTYAQTLYGAPSFVIRGVGVNDSSLGITPAVSVYVDRPNEIAPAFPDDRV